MKQTKESAMIDRVTYGEDDRGILTCWIFLDFRGGYQGFGGLAFPNKELGDDFVKSVCETFEVSKLEELLSKRCKAIKLFGGWNDTIDALESEDGKVFSLYSWRKKHFPDTKSPVEERIQSAKSTARWAQRRLDEANAEIKTLEEYAKTL